MQLKPQKCFAILIVKVNGNFYYFYNTKTLQLCQKEWTVKRMRRKSLQKP